MEFSKINWPETFKMIFGYLRCSDRSKTISTIHLTYKETNCTHQSLFKKKSGRILLSSVADPECFDADLDPTFQADADLDPDPPDPNPFTRVRNLFLQIFNYCFQSLPKLVSVIFSVRMQEEEWGVRDNGWGIRGEGWGAREEGWWRKGEEAVKRSWGGRVRRKGEGEWERKDDRLGRRENWRGMRDEGGEMRDME